MKVWMAVLLVGATAARAQGKPTLIDHPLEVKSAVADAQVAALQDEFRMLLARSSGVLLSTKSSMKAAVGALKRQDCDVRNECLQQLAITAGTLYALYAQLEKNAAATEVTATGRVVNQDGVMARPITRVTVPRTTTFEDAARDAMAQLIEKLALDKLSPVLDRPAEAAKPSAPDAPIVLVQAPPSEPPTSGLRIAGVVVGVGALGAAGLAIGMTVSAFSARGTLPSDGRLVDDAQVRTQASVNQNATIGLVSGVAAGVLGLASVLMIANGGSSASVALVPSPGGAVVGVAGSF